MSPAAFLLTILVGLLLGLAAWGFLRTRNRCSQGTWFGSRDNLLLVGLLVAVFALGVFLAYVVLGYDWQ
jgi:formate hydrogenlyase subunit 3/multisubunit Na+/H+ antiporter MnhD subunit